MGMDMPRTRKPVNVTLDPDLVEWLHNWRLSQTAEVPFGRALDACIRVFREAQAKTPLSDQKDLAEEDDLE
jgi:hypothetical protein